MASKRIANPSEVRTWAAANLADIEGLPENYRLGDRGQFPPAVITAFNKAHKNVKYVRGAFVNKTAVKFTRVTDKGRKVPGVAHIDTTKVREAAREAGLALPSKGRLPQAVKVAYAQGPEALKALAATV
jgi:hypothetical protein